MQTLRGFVGQGMDAKKPRTPTPTIYCFTTGPNTFTAPRPGKYRFVLRGSGSRGDGATPSGAASAAFVQADRNLTQGQTVALVVAPHGQTVGAASTATFPGGEVLTAGGSNGLTAGVATAGPGDIALNGSAPGVAGLGNNGGQPGAGGVSTWGGGGAPGWDGHKGGRGGSADGSSLPGLGGGGGGDAGPTYGDGSDAIIIVYEV